MVLQGGSFYDFPCLTRGWQFKDRSSRAHGSHNTFLLRDLSIGILCHAHNHMLLAVLHLLFQWNVFCFVVFYWRTIIRFHSFVLQRVAIFPLLGFSIRSGLYILRVTALMDLRVSDGLLAVCNWLNMLQISEFDLTVQCWAKGPGHAMFVS